MVRYAVTVSGIGGYLHAVDFSAPQGRFEGTITPFLILGRESREGIPLSDVTLTLGPIKQVCWVRFLPDFSDSLALFGLSVVEEEVRRRVLTRLQEIYQPPDRLEDHVNVEFRAEGSAHLCQLCGVRMRDGNRDEFLLFLYSTSHRRTVSFGFR